jgi:hypothetical protein
MKRYVLSTLLIASRAAAADPAQAPGADHPPACAPTVTMDYTTSPPRRRLSSPDAACATPSPVTAPSAAPGSPAPVVGEIADPPPPFFTPVLVGAAVGGLALYGGGWLGYQAGCGHGCKSDVDRVIGAGLGGVLGLTWGTTITVMLLSGDADHESAVGKTWLDSLLGGLAGAAGAGALKTKYVAVDIAAIGLFSAVGASVGVQSTRRRIRALPTIQLVPAAAGGQTGVTLVGRF